MFVVVYAVHTVYMYMYGTSTSIVYVIIIIAYAHVVNLRHYTSQVVIN